jgi:hypothetical protein
MSDLTKSEVLLGIQCGLFDNELDEITSAIHRRRNLVSAEKANQLSIGDTIVIGRISPKAFSGKRAQVVSFDGDKLLVALLDTVGYVGKRGYIYAGHEITIQSVCIAEVRS